jgi:hypothetical protein
MLGQQGAARGLESLALASLVGQVCHDLNNHLATLLGKTEVALMVNDPARYRPALEHGLEAGQPARALVAELQRVMTWIRDGEAGVPASDAVASAARLCERACAKRGIQLSIRNESPGLMLLDPGRVAVVCWSLLDRLVQGEPCAAEPTQRRWMVTTWAEGSWIGISVEAPELLSCEPAVDESLQQLAGLLGLLGGDLSVDPGRAMLRLEAGESRLLGATGDVPAAYPGYDVDELRRGLSPPSWFV